MGACFSCHTPIDKNNYHRLDSCAHCGRDTHVCRNCDHHDRAFNNECKESSAERVVEKEKTNFCDYFVPTTRGPQGSPGKTAHDLKSAAEALFKKK